MAVIIDNSSIMCTLVGIISAILTKSIYSLKFILLS